ncbi:hypothetical protein GCM10028796_17560 [Ramlibacter monticola]|uniref:DUF551 domain-containing protein n=1 Tax=Ramlibacter monticola TaxID=1926872 RepID=A0A936YXS1_9BURK|nr:hypothetical protein [Ramlibacter monticola]MBL0390582.1 hypothetical protein [Ramlibacter monticola]
MTGTTEARGTFACPICGKDTPHHHPDNVVAAYRDDQARQDGWISTLVRLPNDPVGKFYLCRGHEVIPPNKDEDEGLWQEVHGMLWQRRMAAYMGAEALQWDQDRQSFLLAQWTNMGNPDWKDSDRRAPVYVKPTHWREIPAFGMASDVDHLTATVAGLQAVVKDQRSRILSMQTNHEYEREQLVRELGEARSTTGVAVVRQADAWRPINSAPKDGREVILREGNRVGAACWVKWPDTYDSDGAPAREGGEGWTVGYDGNEWRAPTHWQPLPAAGVTAAAPVEELAMLRRDIERLPKSPGKDDALRHMAELEQAIARGVPAAPAPEPKWICPRCKVDRFKEPCGDPHHPPCALTATASGVQACRKCGGAMKPGKAMGQTMDCSDEGTCSPAGPGKLIDCMKCERCGWSVTAGVGESLQAKALRDPPEVIAAEYDRMVMRSALRQIAGMDPQGVRADDLGRAARVAREALADPHGVAIPQNDQGEKR